MSEEMKDDQNVVPPTIASTQLDNATISDFGTPDFIKVVNLFHPEVIFRIQNEAINNDGTSRDGREVSFYFFHDGVAYCTDSHGFGEYSYLLEAWKFFNSGNTGFENFADSVTAFRIGCPNKAEFDQFMESGYPERYDVDSLDNLEAVKGLYSEFYTAKKNGFVTKNDAHAAALFGIGTQQELVTFLQSGFAPYDDADSYNNYRNRNQPQFLQLYEAYLAAQKGGFTKKSAFEEARTKGFDTAAEFAKFKASGCKTKDEYVRITQKINETILKTDDQLTEITKDAEAAYASKRYEEYVRLRYLAIEKRVTLIYVKYHNRLLPDDVVIEDIIHDFETKIKTTIVTNDDLTNWRRTRNKVIHDNYKISPQMAGKAQKFFDDLDMKLVDLLNQVEKNVITVPSCVEEPSSDEEQEDPEEQVDPDNRRRRAFTDY